MVFFLVWVLEWDDRRGIFGLKRSFKMNLVAFCYVYLVFIDLEVINICCKL